jgi:hypothetical protein
MIHKHVDIWAILLLLLGLALITRTRSLAVRVVHARLHLYTPAPVDVRVGPFHMNRFHEAPPRNPLPPPLRFI